MYVVAFSSWASAVSAFERSAGSTTDSAPPRKRCTRGRGRSVDSASAGGALSKCCFQYAICSFFPSPSNQSRCHRLKSAYWIVNGGRLDGKPAAKDEYDWETSRTKTPEDQPSVEIWC